jgi:hypothetical protein
MEETLDQCRDHRLDGGILTAHRTGDLPRLTSLYGEAGDSAALGGDIDRACFFWTQAYVIALQAGDESASSLCRRLAEHGRI